MKLISNFNFSRLAENAIIVAYYPYTTFVQNRLFDVEERTISIREYSEEEEIIINFCNAIMNKAIQAGCKWDNKVAVEISFNNGVGEYSRFGNLFVGHADLTWAIGLSIWQPDSYTQQYNQFFTQRQYDIYHPVGGVINHNCARGIYEYNKVATVPANSLNDAYHMAQNDANLAYAELGIRSTCVGDIICENDVNRIHMVRGLGFDINIPMTVLNYIDWGNH